jgi:hypothetical protein
MSLLLHAELLGRRNHLVSVQRKYLQLVDENILIQLLLFCGRMALPFVTIECS